MGATVYVNDINMDSPKETIMAKLSWLFCQSEFKISYLILIFVYYDPSLGDWRLPFREVTCNS